VHKPVGSPVAATVIGCLILGLVSVIPIAGVIVGVVLHLLGEGAVIITGFGTDREWWWNRQKKNGNVAA
jgi:hypothetical protein